MPAVERLDLARPFVDQGVQGADVHDTVRVDRIRKRIEEAFGWMKSVGGMRRPMLRGSDRVGWAFTFKLGKLRSSGATPAQIEHAEE